MKFNGMQCALNALAESIRAQIQRDKCICASCWLGFKTLYRNVEKDSTVSKEAFAVKKDGEKYWESLKKKR